MGGAGTSLWRGQRIPYAVSGTVDLASGAVALEKEHRGAYTNRVAYRGGFLALAGPDVDELAGRWAAATLAPSAGAGAGAGVSGAAPASSEALRRERAGSLLHGQCDRLRFALFGNTAHTGRGQQARRPARPAGCPAAPPFTRVPAASHLFSWLPSCPPVHAAASSFPLV